MNKKADILMKAVNLKKSYGEFKALKGVDFEANPGEIYSIIGPNGAGKSTLLKIICGLISPTSGQIDVTDKSLIGYMPEENAIYEDMTVSEYLKFFASLYRVKPRIKELLDFLKLDDKKIGEMSKGMKRKTLLARSLINDPLVLVYDEPASGLDPLTAQNMLDYIVKLKNEGKTIILSAHDLAQVEAVTDRLMILNKGRVEVSGTLDYVKERFGHEPFRLKLKNKTKTFRKKSDMIDYINKHRPQIVSIDEENSLQKIFVEKFKNG